MAERARVDTARMPMAKNESANRTSMIENPLLLNFDFISIC
jgi:hypothetical protein